MKINLNIYSHLCMYDSYDKEVAVRGATATAAAVVLL